jgi:RHS repeat-associated protein
LLGGQENAVVVEYTYDAWGKPLGVTGLLSASVGVKNPYRYRGYRYDEETGLYYLQSRYYNPRVGRFINADGLILDGSTLLEMNLFAYCVGNPMTYYDPNGKTAIATTVQSPAFQEVWRVLTVAAAAAGPYAVGAVIVVGGILILATAADGSTSESLITNSQLAQGRAALKDAVDSSLSKAQAKSTTRDMNEHHIVAQTARLAQPSRDILGDAGMDVNSEYNRVYLNKNLHQYLHTTAYYIAVNMIMEGAVEAAKKSGNLRGEVVTVLESMKIILQEASFKL